MKIQLPNGQKIILNDDLSIDEKLKITEELAETWIPVLRSSWKIWNSDSTRFFFDSLANYIVWHKEEEDDREDKEVMSRNKTNRLYRGRKDIPFSSLSEGDKDLLGLDGGNVND